MKTFTDGVHYELVVNKVGHLCVGNCVIDAGSILAPHHHAVDEAYIITAGSGWVLVGDSENLHEAGDTIFVPANEVHSVSAGVNGISLSFVFACHDWHSINYVMVG